MVSLEGQRATPVAGSFGSIGDQMAASLSRTGRDIASVVVLRPGAPDMASSLWIGPNGGAAAQATDSRSSQPAVVGAGRRGVGGGRLATASCG